MSFIERIEKYCLVLFEHLQIKSVQQLPYKRIIVPFLTTRFLLFQKTIIICSVSVDN